MNLKDLDIIKKLLCLLYGMVLFFYPALAQKNNTEFYEKQIKALNILKRSNADSALQIASKLKTGAVREGYPYYQGRLSLLIGTIYYQKDKIQQARQHFKEALEIFEKAKHTKGICMVYNNLGVLEKEEGHQQLALDYLDKTLAMRLATRDSLTAASYNSIGLFYFETGKYPKALDYFLKGLKAADQYADEGSKLLLLNNVALVYWKQMQYEDAYTFLYQSMLMDEKAGNPSGVAISLNNLSGIRLDQDRYDEARALSEKALAIAQKINYTRQISKSYSVQSEIDFRQKRFEESIKKSSMAAEIARKNNSRRDLSLILIKQAEAYNETGAYDSAQNVIEEGITVTEQAGLLKEKESLYRLAGNLYARKGNWLKASAYYVLRDELKDSLFSERNSRIVLDLKEQYESEQKEARIRLLDQENDIKQLELERTRLTLARNKLFMNEQEQRLRIGQLELANKEQLIKNQQLDDELKTKNISALKKQTLLQRLEITNKSLAMRQQNYLIWGLALAALAITGIAISYLMRQKLKQEQQLQQEIYKRQSAEAKALFEGEQNERIRIARDLHDGVGQMLSLVKMSLSTLETGDAAVQKAMMLADKTIDEVRNVSHNLIPEELNFGIFRALENLAEKVNSSGSTQMKITIPEPARSLRFEKQNELSIYRIVQEVVNNMIKHAAATEIDLSINTLGNQVLIALKDNGCGLDLADIDRSKGIGWKNINARVTMLDGKINVQSEKLSGTQIEITLPTNGTTRD